mmetsp:Transcript_79700/g.125788  ORF Transcript_79700/g.125788 Transcript_79700/m.125788 type:complete len:202 (-) Transcript_79700:862-1467(-)
MRPVEVEPQLEAIKTRRKRPLILFPRRYQVHQVGRQPSAGIVTSGAAARRRCFPHLCGSRWCQPRMKATAPVALRRSHGSQSRCRRSQNARFQPTPSQYRRSTVAPWAPRRPASCRPMGDRRSAPSRRECGYLRLGSSKKWFSVQVRTSQPAQSVHRFSRDSFQDASMPCLDQRSLSQRLSRKRTSLRQPPSGRLIIRSCS